jgi:hypothetical protein
MAATPTATELLGLRHPIAGGLKHIAILAKGGSTITAAEVGLQKIIAAWLQDVDDNAELSLTTYSGSSVVAAAEIGAGTYQIFHLVGF